MTSLLPALLWLLACDASTDASPPPEAKELAPLRTFARPEPVAIEALAGHLQAASGHVRFFNFWASWCGPCLTELPVLREFALRHPEIEVVFINVDFPRVQETQVPTLLRERRLEEMSHLFLQSSNPDRDLRTHVEGWKSEIPATLVVDADGRRREFQAVELKAGDLEAALARAMQ
jgi:thiol-disulfide isomerase/thioredoxin